MTMEYTVVRLVKLAQPELPTGDLQVVHEDQEVLGVMLCKVYLQRLDKTCIQKLATEKI